MLPFQRKKVDISKLNEEEQKLFAKYGKLPTHKNMVAKMQKERKYFDSGDYALSKAGVAPQTTVGTAIPNPENIPHASSPGNGHGSAHQSISISPTNSTGPFSKESGLSHSEKPEGYEDETPEDVLTTTSVAVGTDASSELIIVESTSVEAEVKSSINKPA